MLISESSNKIISFQDTDYPVRVSVMSINNTTIQVEYLETPGGPDEFALCIGDNPRYGLTCFELPNDPQALIAFGKHLQQVGEEAIRFQISADAACNAPLKRHDGADEDEDEDFDPCEDSEDTGDDPDTAPEP